MVSGELTPDRANHDYHGPEGTDCYMSATFNRQEAEARSICTNEGCRASSEYVLVIRSLRWREDRVEVGLVGPVLVRVDSTPVRVSAGKQRALLATMPVAAREAGCSAALHGGRHRELIAELQPLVSAEPLRERLHELLMLALYRSGQRAAALDAYRRAWRQLVDQVGIEPGPGLR